MHLNLPALCFSVDIRFDVVIVWLFSFPGEFEMTLNNMYTPDSQSQRSNNHQVSHFLPFIGPYPALIDLFSTTLVRNGGTLGRKNVILPLVGCWIAWGMIFRLELLVGVVIRSNVVSGHLPPLLQD